MKELCDTDIIGAFARAYHRENNSVRIFDDPIARRLFTDAEYETLLKGIAKDSGFSFAQGGDAEDRLRSTVDKLLSPSTLGRSAFCEEALKTAVLTGTRQYVIMAAGYDSFAFRQPEWAKPLRVFELDDPAVSTDKLARLTGKGVRLPDNVKYISGDISESVWRAALESEPGYDASRKSFFNLTGIACSLSPAKFAKLMADVSSICAEGSTIVFDYSDGREPLHKDGGRECGGYSYERLETMLEENGFLIYEHLEPTEITERYFSEYNKACPAHKMYAQRHVCFCLAVKKRL